MCCLPAGWGIRRAVHTHSKMAPPQLIPFGEEDLSCITPEVIEELNRTEDVVDVLLTLVTWTHFNPFNPSYMNMCAEADENAPEMSAMCYCRDGGWLKTSKIDLGAEVMERMARHVAAQMRKRVNSAEMQERLEMYEQIGHFANAKLAEEALYTIRSNSYLVELARSASASVTDL
jgi:hypothetical protein